MNPKYEFKWSVGQNSGVVHANTTGEARALIKKEIKSPLPKRNAGFIISRKTREE